MSAKSALGIFWDIENCQIPQQKAITSVVKNLREFVAEKHPECGYAKEFCCACDAIRLGAAISDSLDRNGVTVVHVNARAKNAAEDKLQELIEMYVDKYGGTGSAVLCIISSDINLAKQIRNARRKDLNVVLIHGLNCSIDLKNLVNECYLYEDIIKDADNCNKGEKLKEGVLEVSNLPLNKPFELIKSRLTQLTDNCGGRPGFIQNGRTTIKFACVEDAKRCLNRINGQDVFGHTINVSLCNKSLNQQNFPKNTGNHSKDGQQKPGVLEVSNLPLDTHFEAIKNRLTHLTSNFGGQPQFIQNGKTSICFPSQNDAQNCLAGLQGKDVFGNKINVSLLDAECDQKQTTNRSRNQQNRPKNANKNRRRSRPQNQNNEETDECCTLL